MTKLSRKNFLDNNKFWELIESIDKSKSLNNEFKQYISILSKLSKEELLGFDYWINFYLWDSYSSDLWAAAYIAMGGCSDDGFDYFRYWLISRGKEIYYNALTDVESLIHEFKKVSPEDIPEFSDFSMVVEKTYSQNYNDSYYNEIKKYEDNTTVEFINIDWEETEESLKKKCPKLFRELWNKSF